MRILITSTSTDMGKILTEGLSDDKEVVQLDRVQPQPFNVNTDLIKGIDAIVHLLDTDIKTDVSTSLDLAMRGTYDYCGWLAKRNTRVVLLSSLSLFGKYDGDMRVTETWRPTVTTAPKILCNHLAEYVCRNLPERPT
ncbi:MAG: hypothetical protein CM1200mP3_13750 [Chloroflexota bacterium]|nr:MAG: hypothetical protein CM1200mP3_13750 [Chloroflexota bacterium]